MEPEANWGNSLITWGLWEGERAQKTDVVAVHGLRNWRAVNELA